MIRLGLAFAAGCVLTLSAAPPTARPRDAAPPTAKPDTSLRLPRGMVPAPGAKGDTVLYFQGGKAIGWSISQANGTQTHFDGTPDGEVTRHLRNDPAQPVTMRLTFAKGAKTHAILYQKPNVKSMEMDLKGDVQHGVWKSYHPNGRLRDSCRKEAGLCQGMLVTLDEKGRLARRDRVKDGKPDGVSEIFYGEGPRQSETGYRAGFRDGAHIAYAVNGSVVTRGFYSMGVPTGVWEEYYPNGQVSARSRLADWRILERKCFNPQGTPRSCADDAEEAKALEGLKRNWERERARLMGQRPKVSLPAGPRPAGPPAPAAKPGAARPPEPAAPPADRLGQ